MLQQAHQACPSEVIPFIERDKLYRLGCRLVDMSLPASTLIAPDAHLWALDQQLEHLATRFNPSYCQGCPEHADIH